MGVGRRQEGACTYLGRWAASCWRNGYPSCSAAPLWRWLGVVVVVVVGAVHKRRTLGRCCWCSPTAVSGGRSA